MEPIFSSDLVCTSAFEWTSLFTISIPASTISLWFLLLGQLARKHSRTFWGNISSNGHPGSWTSNRIRVLKTKDTFTHHVKIPISVRMPICTIHPWKREMQTWDKLCETPNWPMRSPWFIDGSHVPSEPQHGSWTSIGSGILNRGTESPKGMLIPPFSGEGCVS